MYYYQFNIGDYQKSTKHLTPIEDIAYRRLLDLYYDSEKPLDQDIDVLTRLICLRDHKIETQQILSEFFQLTKKGYIQKRVEKELSAYSAKATAARVNGKKGGRPKKTQSVNLANQELTQEKAKQETLNKKHKPVKDIWELPEWINKTAWNEFEQHRKEIKKPLSNLAKTKAANSLNGFTPQEQQSCIDKTIQNRWSGLFPEKIGANNETNKRTGNNGSGKQSNHARYSQAIQKRIRDSEQQNH